MKFYTIQGVNILTAESMDALKRFYDNVEELPQDYETGKYIVKNNKLVLNDNWETEQKEKTIVKRKEEIKEKLKEFDLKRIRAICENEIRDEKTKQTWLEYYNNQIINLRKELTEISK